MTSIIKIKRRHEIVILTDGLGRTADGEQYLVAKCSMLPRAPALVASRGVSRLAGLVAVDCATWSFDRLVAEGAVFLKVFCEKMKELPGFKEALGREEINVAGWSDRHQRLAMYFLVADDRYADQGIRPFEFHELLDDVTIAPGPPTAEAAATLKPVAPDKFQVGKDGLHIMELQRSWCPEYRDAIGGHIMAYTVRRDGVSASVVHRWPAEGSPDNAR